MKSYFFLIIACFLVISSTSFAQNTSVEVGGDVAKPFKLTKENFARFTSVHVKLKSKDGREHDYAGIKLFDILTQAEAVPNNQLHGKLLTKYVLISAFDGYQVVIALPEIDPAFTDETIILANKMDGEDLPANLGPFRLIVPMDKKLARSAMHVTNIDVLTAAKK